MSMAVLLLNCLVRVVSFVFSFCCLFIYMDNMYEMWCGGWGE